MLWFITEYSCKTIAKLPQYLYGHNWKSLPKVSMSCLPINFSSLSIITHLLLENLSLFPKVSSMSLELCITFMKPYSQSVGQNAAFCSLIVYLK